MASLYRMKLHVSTNLLDNLRIFQCKHSTLPKDASRQISAFMADLILNKLL